MPGEDDGDDDGDSDDGDDDGDDDGGKPARVPLKSLEAERKKRQEAEAELQRLRDEATEAERKAKEKSGEYVELYEATKAELADAKGKLTALQEREARRVERIEADNEALRKDLAPDLLELVPDGLDPDAEHAQLVKLGKLATKTVGPKGTRTGGGKPPGVKVPAEALDFAAKHGMNEEDGLAVWSRTKRGKEWAKENNFTP